MVIPGTYVEVRPEETRLPTGGAIPTGNIGIIGTAEKGDDQFHVLTGFEQAAARFGEPLPWKSDARGGSLTLVRALRLLFINGAGTVHARRVFDPDSCRAATCRIATADGASVLKLGANTPGAWGNKLKLSIENPAPRAPGSDHRKGSVNVTLYYEETREEYPVQSLRQLARHIEKTSKLAEVMGVSGDGLPAATDEFYRFSDGANGRIADDLFTAALEDLAAEPVQIIVVAGSNFSNLKSALRDHIQKTEIIATPRLAVIGADTSAVEAVIANSHEVDDKRMVLVAPGLKQQDAATGQIHELPPYMAAAAVAGKLSCLPPSVSITNKSLAGIDDLASHYNVDELRLLVDNRVLVLTRQNGIRVVKGITTHAGAFNSISVVRILDLIKEGCRRYSQPFIGSTNTAATRRALQTVLGGFLDGMVRDGSLSDYSLEIISDPALTRPGELQARINFCPTVSPEVFRVAMNLSLEG